MVEQSSRLGMPFLSAGQAQKEIYHNEALTIVDILLHGCIEGDEIDTPPLSPIPGQCWIIGSAPTGAWTSNATEIAAWTNGGWRFFDGQAGMEFWHVVDGVSIRHDGTHWVKGVTATNALEVSGIQVIGAQAAAIVEPLGGGFVDAEARTAVIEILSALRSHGLIAT